jgi:hypothetical protein
VTLTPEQAVEAAAALGAAAVCPVHYGLFNNPPQYVEQDDIVPRVRRAAEDRGITPLLMADGESVPLADQTILASTGSNATPWPPGSTNSPCATKPPSTSPRSTNGSDRRRYRP